MIKFSENQKIVVNAFINGYVREDNYDGVNAIYAFMAEAKDLYGFPIFNPESKKDTERNIRIFLDLLEGMKLRPDQVFINQDSIGLVWSGRATVFDNAYDYLIQSIEFANYIDTIKFSKLVVSTGSFDSDPITPKNLINGAQMEKAVSFETNFTDSHDYFIEVVDVEYNYSWMEECDEPRLNDELSVNSGDFMNY